MGSEALFRSRKYCVSRIPLLKGEGGPKGRVRGAVTAPFLYPSPAASRHPLPSGEGFVPKHLPIWTAQHHFFVTRIVPHVA